jgi:hypothetical protein
VESLIRRERLREASIRGGHNRSDLRADDLVLIPICGATRLQLRFPKVFKQCLPHYLEYLSRRWSLFERMVLLINSKVGGSTAQSCSVKSPSSSGRPGFRAPARSPRQWETRRKVTVGRQQAKRCIRPSKAGLRASSMLDIAVGILVLASVCIFLAHAVDSYRAQ